MTVLLALRCADGMVMGADSQASDASNNTRQQIDKIWELNSRAVWGATGSVAVIDDIRAKFEKGRGELDRSADTGKSMRVYVGPVLTEHYKYFIQNVPGVMPSTPATTVLACGYDAANEPFIIEIDYHCQLTHYEELGGVYAVGSGGAFAQVATGLLSHFDLAHRPYTFGLLAAYRVLNIVIETSAQGVGHPIRLWAIPKGEAPHLLTDDEMREVASNYAGWLAVEADALEVFMTPGPAVPEAPVPPPAAC